MDFEQLFLKLREEASTLKEGHTLHLLSLFSVSRNELGHSNVIAALISPNCLPGWETTAKSFLAMLGDAINRDLADETILEVVREKYANGRLIDLYIKTDNYQIIIENKIDAGDQDWQIHDYIAYAERTAKPRAVLAYYLTLDGKSPSEESIPAEERKRLKEEDRFSELSYRDDIIPWLEGVACGCENSMVSYEIKTYIIALKELCDMANGDVINFCRDKYQFVTDSSTTEELYTIAKGLRLIAMTRQRLSILKKVLETLEDDIREHNYSDMSVHYISHNGMYFDDFDSFVEDTLKTFEYYGIVLDKGDDVKILIEFQGIDDAKQWWFGFDKCHSSSTHHIERLKQGLSIDSMAEYGRLYEEEDIWGPSVSIGRIQENIETCPESFVVSMIKSLFWKLLQANNLIYIEE